MRFATRLLQALNFAACDHWGEGASELEAQKSYWAV